MAKRNVPFVDGVEAYPIPEGKRVTSVSVTKDGGLETVVVSVEDVPVLPPEVVATVTVQREV